MNTQPTTQATRTSKRRLSSLLIVGALAFSAVGLQPYSSLAVPAATGVVFDDFDDNDTSDWGFFGGNDAGGGGGPLADRPAAGTHYFSTGWGGNGTASGFYGGAFKNLPNGSQTVLPADPWFNMWVLNQSDATVDQYNLELTLREDTNGDGWTNGLEDSIGLDTTFTSAQFNDEWTILSAPLSSFFDRGTGGNAVFDGNVDEMVIVFGGVSGGVGTVIEVDFDQITFTSGAPAAFDEVVFDDMEHGDPFGNGWFAFNGAVGGGGIAPNAVDLPPALGGAFSLETGWGSGGTPGFYGGFGRTSPTDLSGTEHFNFWINPNAGQDYTLEINLQDDDNSDGAANAPDDDEFQYDCVVSDTGPCAVAGGGWQLVSIPLDDFFDDNSFFTGGNGLLDPTPAARGGNGELINVVVAVIGGGSDVNFRTDYWAFSLEPIVVDSSVIIDDFENGLPNGVDGNGALLGFYTFQGAGSGIAISTTATPPAPTLPAVGTPNNVLQMNIDSTSFAGYIHAFENTAVDTWVTQNWSTSEGISFWFNGTNSGAGMFLDILDNRTAGSTSDEAERWTVTFTDDSDGWTFHEFPFSAFTRKEIGNGAPNDGLGLFEMHGYAFGALGTFGPQEFYFDQVSLYGIAEPPALAAQFSINNTFIDEGTTGDVGVKLNRPMGPDDPAQVSIDFATERSTAIVGEEYTATSGTVTFVNGGPTELFFPVETFDDTKFEGDEQIVIRLTNPVDVERGALFQGSVLIQDNDPFDPDLLDDFEQGAFQWDTTGGVEIESVRSESGDPAARPGQDAVENVLAAAVPLSVDIAVQGTVCKTGTGVVPVQLLSTPNFDATSVDHTTVTFGAATEIHVNKKTGVAKRHVDDVNNDGLDDLVFHFRGKDIGVACGDPVAFNGSTFGGEAITTGGSDAAFGHDFAIGQDWTGTDSLEFWYNGAGGGEEIVVDLKDNRAPDPGPSGWNLVWSDEFDEAAGTPPNPANWAYEIGDTTPDGKNGWGNEELQYYTDDPDNAATDGSGNLVITLDEADGTQECYYGPCEFESARLLTQNKAEFAYGRVESRLQVPDGGDGLWPAFWSLGTDITYNPWPGAGEIDFMEYVSRLPNEIFGTVHGPGYNGGGSIGGIYDFGLPVADAYHTFTVEWEPNLITWYVDGIQYHQVTPADVPGPWVFDKPFFLLLNFAIGGNFGGAVDPSNTYPQEYAIDYVRVFQGPDTAERFEASFTDDVAGWQQVTIPVSDFTRSADQPAGAPDDGLGLDEVWGYGFATPNGTASGELLLDHVRLVDETPPTVAITDDVAIETATGDVTFTFTFSEDVGSSFTSDDIDLTGGTKGAFTRVDGRHATLVARPPADSTGILEVNVAVGTFADLAGNVNDASASAQQAYDTPPPPAPGGGFVITFDEPDLTLLGFGGAEDSSVVADPTDGTNKVLQVVKNPPEFWAGTIVGTESDLTVPVIPFSESEKTVTARVWSPDAGIPVRMKVENSAASGVFVETEATTTSAGAWETLTFDFANDLGVPLNLAAVYDKVVVFFDFGTVGSGKTYYADDITFPAGTPPPPPPPPPSDGFVITFDEAIAPLLTGFGGAEGAVVADPANASNMVAQVIKTAGAETWAGTTVSTGPNFSVPVIPLAPGSSTMTARVWSPDAGIPVRLKAEDASDVTHTVETEATTTVAGAWETLTFDFANEAPGTEPLIHPDWTFSKVSIFFDFGTPGADKTYYVDDITWPAT